MFFSRNIDKKTNQKKREGDLVQMFLSNAGNRKLDDTKHFVGNHISGRDQVLINFFGKHKNEADFDKFEDSGVQYVKVPKNIESNTEQMLFYIKTVLDKFFGTVLIREYFDESLILLRRKLCWKLQDILYFPLKVGENGSRTEQYPDDLIEKHKQLLVSFNNLT